MRQLYSISSLTLFLTIYGGVWIQSFTGKNTLFHISKQLLCGLTSSLCSLPNISQSLAILHRLLTYLSMNKIRLAYHWSELWRTLLTLMRFLTTYANDVMSSSHIETLTSSLVNVIAFCVFAGDAFLPDPASYDDLFYKLVETGPVIAKFRDVYSLDTPSSPTSNSTPNSSSQASKSATPIAAANKDDQIPAAAIDTLLSVSSHFYDLLFHQGKFGGDGHSRNNSTSKFKLNGAARAEGEPFSIPAVRKKNLSPREVHRIIKQGYDTLDVQPPDGLNEWERWRETDWKPQLKRATRVAVDDARHLTA